MKFSKLWLNDIIGSDIATATLIEQLTMAGLEATIQEPAVAVFHGVVVGEILEVSPHPNADKLTICTVNAGEENPNLSIVCGATNVRPNLKVPVALIGAELPNDFKIKKAKLRGVESSGMLCAARELGLPETNPGIWELPVAAPIGIDLRKYLALDDEIIELELTANRGDCLSMFGIAREVAAVNRLECKFPPEIPKFQVSTEVLPVVITVQDICPHYCGRIIRGVNNRVTTPSWIEERLRRLGETPINFIVDVTNYVMLELGQPLHAFDLAKIRDRIEVRQAKSGEILELLDGQTITLNDEALVIADSEKPVALAGVMGGMTSGVYPETQDVFLESAFFIPAKVMEQTRAFKLSTDAAYRYERGVDHELQLLALERATALILEIAGGKPSAISEVKSQEHLPQSPVIELHRHQIQNILGITIADQAVIESLSHLGMILQPTADGWQVTPPSWRAFDIKIEEDLVEEIARLYGYHLIPEQKIVAELGVNYGNGKKSDLDRLGFLMEDLGYHEAITYSFIDEKLQTMFGGEVKALPLANPISSEQTVMRTTLWPGLIKAVKYNAKRQQPRVRLFEIGLRFVPEGDRLEQRLSIAGLMSGSLYPEQWGIKQKESADFFDLKNDVTTILKLLVGNVDIEYVATEHQALHPRRSAQVYVGGKPIGFIGEIHPLVKQQLELDKKIVLFEIDLSLLINKLPDVFKKFSIFPKITRDIAIIVNKEIPWAKIRQKIVDISGELLQNVVLFDVYCNENIGLDKCSMAIHLTFQSINRTLVDTEVEALVDRIILELRQTFGANLRG